ncbi:peptidase M23 [Streptacidiphilus sp. EB103A]|uniref:peptidase M23 n=1 Tax=Streptacidiphilus sp. EB103A TaxID=3156275 RepID=UPI003514F63C
MNEQEIAKQAAGAAIQAAGVATKGLQLKAGVIAAVVLLIALIVIGLMAPAPDASGATCADSGPGITSTDPGTGTGTPGTGTVNQEQVAVATTIDTVAIQEGLPGRATLVALMTGLQESSLTDIDHGDADSLGVFQQRPSMGWGSKTDILNVNYATQSFFQGRGTNKGLVEIANWTTLPLGTAAQDVQHSQYPDLYAGQEDLARQIAAQAGIDLERPGTTGSTSGTAATSGTASPDSSTAPVTTANPCAAPVTAPTGTPGQQFSDGTQTWNVNNPRSAAQAIAWVLAHSGAGSTGGWYDKCLAFTANVYGWSYSGVNTALDEWNAIPAAMRHPGDRNPPPGALLFWSTGNPAGHIAIYVGGGRTASTDILRVGYVDVVPASEIETKWHATYLGWAVPDFPHGG